MVNPNRCHHINIHFEDFFKEGKNKNDGSIDETFKWHDVYCLDCGETKGRKFATGAQRHYCYEIDKWLKSQGIKKGIWDNDWIKFLEENSYYGLWKDAYHFGRLDPNNFNDPIIKQGLFFEFTRMIEYLCLEFKKEKVQERLENTRYCKYCSIELKEKHLLGVCSKDECLLKLDKELYPEKYPNNSSIEREKEQLQNEINELKNKPNKTSEEEAELTDKQEQLDKLTKPANTEQNDSNSWLKPTLIIGGGILLMGVIFLLVNSKKKNNH